MPRAKTFWSLVDKNTLCWLWRGSKRADGYGIYRGKRAHRIAYTLLIGSIPRNMELHHKPTCPKNYVNPDHLQLVTRRNHPDSAPSINRNKTHCPRRHEYTPENTYIDLYGYRQCKKCNLLNYYRRKRERRFS